MVEYNKNTNLLLEDGRILFLFGLGPETLPGQFASKEVHEDVAKRLHVVAAGLLIPFVIVDACVPRGTAKTLVLSETNVRSKLLLPIVFRQPKVNGINARGSVLGADQEVVRLNIAVQKVLRVNVLYPGHQHFTQLARRDRGGESVGVKAMSHTTKQTRQWRTERQRMQQKRHEINTRLWCTKCERRFKIRQANEPA